MIGPKPGPGRVAGPWPGAGRALVGRWPGPGRALVGLWPGLLRGAQTKGWIHQSLSKTTGAPYPQGFCDVFVARSLMHGCPPLQFATRLLPAFMVASLCNLWRFRCLLFEIWLLAFAIYDTVVARPQRHTFPPLPAQVIYNAFVARSLRCGCPPWQFRTLMLPGL